MYSLIAMEQVDGSLHNRRFRVGVIGLGKQALEDHIPALLAIEEVELVAVADIDEEKLNNFIFKHPLVKGYPNAHSLYQDNKLDFVIIALPHHLHFEATLEALENNIHVFKEKPFAISLKEARAIDSLAKERNLHVGVTLQRRFNPIYSTFFQLIEKIGQPFYVEVKYTLFVEHPEEGWRGDKNLAGGGCLIDMGYHMVDLLIWYFGLPDGVFAETSCHARDHCVYTAEDSAGLFFTYKERGMWGTLLVSRSIAPKQEYVRVYGTKGSINLERGKIERFHTDGQLCESLQRKDSWPSAPQDQINYFIKVINGEKPNISSPQFHFSHLAFIEAAYKSVVLKGYVDPKSFL